MGSASIFGFGLIFKPGWAWGFDSHGSPGVAAFDFLLAEAGGTIQADKHIYVANIPRYIDPSLFKLCRDASRLPLYGFDEWFGSVATRRP